MSDIKLFNQKQIRSVWNEEEEQWYFSVQDVVEILTDSTGVRQYIKRLRQRDVSLNFNWGTICTPVEMIAANNPIYSFSKGRTIQTMAGTSGL